MATSDEMVLADMVSEYETEMLPQFRQNMSVSQHCEICDQPDVEVVDETAEIVAEAYSFACPSHGCDGRGEITTYSLSVGELPPVGMFRVEQSPCGDCGRGVAAQDYADENGPEDVSEYDVGVEAIVSNNMIQHHTSYEPEETMTVCDGCHAEIHRGSGLSEFEPDMKRSEWEASE